MIICTSLNLCSMIVTVAASHPLCNFLHNALKNSIKMMKILTNMLEPRNGSQLCCSLQITWLLLKP